MPTPNDPLPGTYNPEDFDRLKHILNSNAVRRIQRNVPDPKEEVIADLYVNINTSASPPINRDIYANHEHLPPPLPYHYRSHHPDLMRPHPTSSSPINNFDNFLDEPPGPPFCDD